MTKLQKPQDRWNHGATIGKDGEVRLASVSSLELAGRCLRRWKFRYGPHKLQDPPTKSTERGEAGHYAIEVYEKTGERGHLTPDIISGLHQIPPPGPDLLVEQPLIPDLPGGKSGLAFAKLRADGIPIVGKIDLIHGRQENYGVQDIRDARDEPGVLKLTDWKFVGHLKNAKADHELVETLQMAGYAKWAFAVWTALERVRLSHGYFPLKGNPRVATAVVDREQVEKTWKRAEAIGVSIRHAAREPDVNKIDANTRDCHAYGKPCPALVAGVCTANQISSVADFVGVTAAEELIAAASLIRHPNQHQDQNMTQPQFPNQYPPAVASAPAANSIMAVVQGAPPAAPAPDFAAEMARLQGAVAPAPAPAPAAPQIPSDLAALDQLLAQIASYGMGSPTLARAAAVAYARLQMAKGYSGHEAVAASDPNSPACMAIYEGSGELKRYTIPSIEGLQLTLNSVAQHAAQRNQAGAPAQAPTNVAPVTPPDAPQSTFTPPAPAPITQVAPQTVDQAPAVNVVAQPTVPPGAIATVTTALPAAPAGPTAEEIKAQEKAAKEAEKARKKAEKEAAKAAKEAAKQAIAAQAQPTVVNNTVVQTAPAAPAPDPYLQGMMQNQAVPPAPPAPPAPPVQAAPTAGAINFYVDTVVEGVQLTPFWPIVDQICALLTKESGCRDFRDVPKENALAYRWEGALTALIRAANIAGGNYGFDGTWGPIGRVVVEAMRAKVRETGGLFVKGVR